MRIRTHFKTIDSRYRRLDRTVILATLIPDPWQDDPWWVLKFSITFKGIVEVEARLQKASRNGQLILENSVHRGKRGHHVRDIIYLWCPKEKFALRLTKFERSSPHYLEITGDIAAARKFLSRIGI